ncbi:hypothetical protein FQN54_005165 [Arachnomyces sp. PD_36]|nr:hypothetical protein FQN54_005165 [Arachnomyces sp. PD_36]
MSRHESSTQNGLDAVDTASSQATEASSSSRPFSLSAFRHGRQKSRTQTEPIPADTPSPRRSFFRSRSKSPAPPSHTSSLPVRKSHDYPRDGHAHAATVGGRISPSRVTFDDIDGGAPIERTTSPAPMSPRQRTTSSPSPHQWEFSHRSHSGSYSNSNSNSHSHSHSSRKSGDHKRLSGTVNHCGRHGNDWLFGGFSVRESVGKLWKDEDDK